MSETRRKGTIEKYKAEERECVAREEKEERDKVSAIVSCD